MRFDPLEKIRSMSLSQKKLMLSGITIAALFSALWFFVYMPSRAEVLKLEAELSDTQSQIRQIEEIMADGKISGIGIGMLKEKYRRLKERFPEDEEEGIAALSTIARSCGIKVVSSSVQAKTEFVDDSQQPVVFEGKALQVILVSLELKATYKELLKYIQAMRNSLSVLATVESLSIDADEAGPKKLNVVLGVNLYFSS